MQVRRTVLLDDFSAGLDDRRVSGKGALNRFRQLTNAWVDEDGNLKRRPGFVADGELVPQEAIGLITKNNQLRALVARGTSLTAPPTGYYTTPILYFDPPLGTTVHELIDFVDSGRYPVAVIKHDAVYALHAFDDENNWQTIITDADAPRTADVLAVSQSRMFATVESGERMFFSSVGSQRVWNRRSAADIIDQGYASAAIGPATPGLMQWYFPPLEGGRLANSIGSGSQTHYAAYAVQVYMGSASDEVLDDGKWGDGTTIGATLTEVTSGTPVAGECRFESVAAPSGAPTTNTTWVRVSANSSAASPIYRAFVIPAAEGDFWHVNRPVAGLIPKDTDQTYATAVGITATGATTYELPADFIHTTTAGHWQVYVNGTLQTYTTHFTAVASSNGPNRTKIVFVTAPLVNAFIDIYQPVVSGLSCLVPPGTVRIRGAEVSYAGGQVTVSGTSGDYFLALPINNDGSLGTLTTVTDNTSVTGTVRWKHALLQRVTVSGGAITAASMAKLRSTNRTASTDAIERERIVALAGSQDAGWITISRQSVASPVMGMVAAKDVLIVHTEQGVQAWSVPADPEQFSVLGFSPLPKATASNKDRRSTWDGGSFVDPYSGDLTDIDADGGPFLISTFGALYRSTRLLRNDQAIVRTDGSAWFVSLAGQLFNAVQTTEATIGVRNTLGVQDARPISMADRGVLVLPHKAGKRLMVLSWMPEREIVGWSEWTTSALGPVESVAIDGGQLVIAAAETISAATWKRVLRSNLDGTATSFIDYGETTGLAYQTTARWHYLDFNQPGRQKQLIATELVMSGSWSLSFLTDPRNEALATTPLAISATTYNGGKIPLAVQATMIGVQLTSRSETGAELEQLALDLRTKDR